MTALPAGLLGSDLPLRDAFDAALVDLDGVAFRGTEAVPGAPEALAAARAAGMKIVFVTNNASRTPEQVAAHLGSVGIAAEPAEVLTAAQAVALLMIEHVAAGARVLVVGGDGLREAVAEQGFEVVETAEARPAAVVQGFAPDVSWRQLAEAAYAVRAGAQYFASNLDRTLPNERGIAPGNGSLVAAVVAAAGVAPIAAGKPEPGMFRVAAERAGAQRPLVIGDRLDTDLAGARAAGFPGLMVLSGVDTVAGAAAAPPAHRPSFLAADLTALAEPQPTPHQEDGWWVVGTARARAAADGIEVEGDGLDRDRALCVATWAAADARGDDAVGTGVASPTGAPVEGAGAGA